jgi:hypothetical protein
VRIQIPVAAAFLYVGATQAASQMPAPGARYRTRASDCRYEAPAGTPIQLQIRRSATEIDGYTAAAVTTYSSGELQLNGGEIAVCTEYGRVEIEDSDDDRVRVQVRVEASGEGSADAAAAARRAVEESRVRVHASRENGRLVLRVWSDTLTFTPSAQPGSVNLRIQVPARGAYRLAVEAYHGSIAVRRLTVAGGTIRGRVGDKFKGIPGYVGMVELDNVVLAGDLDVSSDGEALSSPMIAKVRVAASSRLAIRNGGDITVGVQPHPGLGVRALASTNDGETRVTIDNGVARDSAVLVAGGAAGLLRVTESRESGDYATSPVKLEIVAVAPRGKINVASMPAAPLAHP